MDTEKKHTLKTIAMAACCLLLAGACENYDRIGTETPAKEVPLTFNASVTNTAVTETRAIVPMEGFTGKSYNFRISVTKTGYDVFDGSSDMTATMSRPDNNVNDSWSWVLKKTFDNMFISDPKVRTGKELKVRAYYSDNIKNGDFTNGIPFDFTKITNFTPQTEILYNTSTVCTVSPTTDHATIPLTFQHAYSRIVVNVKKNVDKGTFNLTGVSIDNLSGEWIKNSGKIDPETGSVMPGAAAGPISETRTGDLLSINTPVTYEFLVPSFMNPGVKDENLMITMMINGVREIFILDREHLNEDGGSYGFRQGYKNTYNLVFNNSRLELNLLNWISVPINDVFGTSPPFPSNSMTIDLTGKAYWEGYYPSGSQIAFFPPKPTYLSPGDHTFQNYLTTVKYGNNADYITPKPVTADPPYSGGKIIGDDENIYTLEKAYPTLVVTKSDVSIGKVPWEDENGQLTAKDICKKYHEGDKDDWRLPRASELRAIMLRCSMDGNIKTKMGFGKSGNDRDKPYWTATEVSETQAWSMHYHEETGTNISGPFISPLNKKERAAVRCVRESN